MRFETFHSHHLKSSSYSLLPIIPVGHVLLSVNGMPVSGRTTEDGRDVFEVIETKVNNDRLILLARLGQQVVLLAISNNILLPLCTSRAE